MELAGLPGSAFMTRSFMLSSGGAAFSSTGEALGNAKMKLQKVEIKSIRRNKIREKMDSVDAMSE